MKNRRFKQLAAGLLVILSLFVSSISACACAHHQEAAAQIETDVPSCHQHSGMEMTEMPMADQPDDSNDSAKIIQTAVSDNNCHCLQPAPKVVSKSENLKTEKQTAEILPKPSIDFKAIPQTISVKTIDFELSFYLSDSFYNLAPSRGPPRL